MTPMVSIASRLKAVRNRAVPKVTIRGMAAALDVPPSSYAAYEDPKKYKKPILPFDLAKRIAVVLEPKGVPARDVMELAGLQLDEGSGLPIGGETLTVTASVAAGVWREHSDWPAEERYPLEVGPSPVPGAERFAMRMDGFFLLSSPVGDWTVSDTTDNDTGERQVDALALAEERPGIVFLKMQCVGRRPLVLIDWYDLPEAKLMVFEVQPANNPAQSTAFTTEKLVDDIHRGLEVRNPDVFVKIAEQAQSIRLVAHTSYASKVVTFGTKGTAATWKRVVEHCKTDV